MKILMICHGLTFDALSFRAANSISYLSKKYMHNITIVSFNLKRRQKEGSNQYDEDYFKGYCDEIEIVEIPTSRFKRIADTIISCIIRRFSGDLRNILDYNFSWKMQREIRRLLHIKKFDVIFVDTPFMLSYVSGVNLPKVLEIWTIPQIYHENYKREKRIHKKISLLSLHFVAKNYEKLYKKFDICIAPTEHDRNTLKSYLKDLEISVIHFGINVDSVNKAFEEDFPSLIFMGNMGSHFNQRSILYFYNEIYPLIKETIPRIKLYIVGKNPSEEITHLTRDKSVIVTGNVEDISPYLARASVVTLPIHGYGIKTRVLEAMAMGKPVVTSSAGIHGIDVTPEENIIIADEPEEFARRVIELLNNEELRSRIGTNARKLMEEEHSWEKMADILNEVLQKAVSRFYEK